MPDTTESETSLLSKVTLELIAEKYMMASMPTNFFRGLMSLYELVSETKERPTQAILDRLEALIVALDTLPKLLETYGLIMALSFKSDLCVPPALRHYAALDKDWIGEIAALANGNKIPLNQDERPFDLPLWEPRRPNLSSPASTTEGQAGEQSARQEEGND